MIKNKISSTKSKQVNPQTDKNKQLDTRCLKKFEVCIDLGDIISC